MLIIPGVLASSFPRVSGSFESIATATGTGSSGTISFTSIPSGFQHLQLRISARSTRNNDLSTVLVRFNSDTGTNYNQHNISSDGTTITASGDANNPSIALGAMPAATSLSNVNNAIIVDIHDYASTTKNKTVRSFSGYDSNTTNRSQIELRSGAWRNTNAITRIDIIDSGSGTFFTTSTTIALYGIRG